MTVVRFLVFAFALAIAITLTSSVPLHRRMISRQSLHKAMCRYSSPDWQMEFNVTLDWIHPNEIFLKRQLRAMIIRIQKMMAEIEMIKFKNRSLWDCRVYKNPLKEIVIDIEDPAEIEKLIAKDKKRRRDWHKPALSYGRNYEEDSLENQNASDEQDAIRNINLNSVKPFQRSLEYDYKIEKDLLKSNDDTTEININDCVDLKRKNEKNNIMSKTRRKTSDEESNYYIYSLPLKSVKQTKKTYFASDPDLNVSDFKYKLKNDYRKENALENNIEMKSKSSSSEELLSSDESELNQEDERTNKNWNWNTIANVNTASNKHGNQEKFVEKISRTNINSYMNVNSDLSTKNSNRIPTFDSKSEEISLGNSTEIYQIDRDEKDHHNSKDFLHSGTEDGEASTKDNRINWQTNFDVLKLEKNNETDLQCHCTSETNHMNVKRKDDNEILSSNEFKESILEQLNSNETVTANKDRVELKKDDDLEKMNNKRIDTIYNLRDNFKFSATKTSPSTKDLPLEHLPTNKNVTENGNKLIRPEHHRGKTSTSAPQRFNKMDGNGTNVQNESKIDKKQSNLMDVLLGGFDDILSTNISRTFS